MKFIGAQDKHVLFVDKCANHLQDILFLRNTKFLYYPPNTRAWCLPWALDQASLERCQLLFLHVSRKMSLPHMAFLAMMTGTMTMQVAAALGGRKRGMNMTMNWFCQAHAAYKLLFAEHCQVWWTEHLNLEFTLFHLKHKTSNYTVVNYRFLWEKSYLHAAINVTFVHLSFL